MYDVHIKEGGFLKFVTLDLLFIFADDMGGSGESKNWTFFCGNH